MQALAERTRPRDLCDVVNVFRNAEACPDAAAMLDVLRQKCDFKGLAVPALTDLELPQPHKNDWGGQRSGRTGFFVETKH